MDSNRKQGTSRPTERNVVVVDYDPIWPQVFASLQAPISDALQGIATSVEHVGSTSVPGLAAKPIIDIDVVLPTSAVLPKAIARLTRLGYIHRGNLGIEGREAFKSPAHLPAHHLYACIQGNTALANHLAVRDHLRQNSPALETYSRLKKRLADEYPMDTDSYIQGKTDFLVEVLKQEGVPESVLRDIREANRKK